MKCLVFAAVILCCYVACGAAPHNLKNPKTGVVRSPPLDRLQPRQRVNEMARAAQKHDKDTDTRLINLPTNYTDMTDLYICCLHVNILEFYLRNVLTTEVKYPHLSTVTSDLHRISTDLKQQGCVVKHVENHKHIQTFKETFFKLGNKGENKAIGEIDILFEYLSRFCKEKD